MTKKYEVYESMEQEFDVAYEAYCESDYSYEAQVCVQDIVKSLMEISDYKNNLENI